MQQKTYWGLHYARATGQTALSWTLLLLDLSESSQHCARGPITDEQPRDKSHADVKVAVSDPEF
jgi:hypothetical protein